MKDDHVQSVVIPTVNAPWWQWPTTLGGVVLLWLVTALLWVQQPLILQAYQPREMMLSTEMLSSTSAPLAWVDLTPQQPQHITRRMAAASESTRELNLALAEMKSEMRQRRALNRSAHGVTAVQQAGPEALALAMQQDEGLAQQVADEFNYALASLPQQNGLDASNDVRFTGSVLREILEEEVTSFIFKLQLAGAVGSYVGSRVAGNNTSQ